MSDQVRVELIAGAALVLVALIGVVGALLANRNATNKMRAENTSQHADGRALVQQAKTSLDAVAAKLELVHGDVRSIDAKVDAHGELLAVHEHRLNDMSKEAG